MALTPSPLRTISISSTSRVDPLWPPKRAGDQLDYWVDYTAFLSGIPGSTLDSYVVRVFGSDGLLGIAQISTTLVVSATNSTTLVVSDPSFLYPGMPLIATGVSYGNTIASISGSNVTMTSAVTSATGSVVSFNGTIMQGAQVMVMLAGGTPGKSYLVEIDAQLGSVAPQIVKSDTIRIAISGTGPNVAIQRGVVAAASLLSSTELALIGQSAVPSSAAVLQALDGLTSIQLQALYATLVGSIPPGSSVNGQMFIVHQP